MMKKTLLASAIALVLAGCTDPEQDQSSENIAIGVKLVASAVDGYLSGAVVWVDSNDDGELDSGEPFAITNKKGKIGVAENSKTCADADLYLKERDSDYAGCLLGNFSLNTPLKAKVRKGFDTFTNQPFEGTLEVEFMVTSSGGIVKPDGTVFDIVISPLTTITTHMTAEEKQLFAIEVFGAGADSADLDRNYMDLVESADDAGKTLAEKNNAKQIFQSAQTIVSAIASLEKEVQKQIKGLDSGIDDNDIPSGTSAMIKTLLEQRKSSGGSLVDTLKNPVSLVAAAKDGARKIVKTMNETRTTKKETVLSENALETSLNTSLDVDKTVSSVEQTDAIFTKTMNSNDIVKIQDAVKVATKGMQTVREIIQSSNKEEAIVAAKTYTTILSNSIDNFQTTGAADLDRLKSDQSDPEAIAKSIVAEVKTQCASGCSQNTTLNTTQIAQINTNSQAELLSSLSKPKMAPLVVFPVNTGALDDYLNGLNVDYIRDSTLGSGLCLTPGYKTEFVLRDTNRGVLCLVDASLPQAETISLKSGASGTNTIIFDHHVNNGSALIKVPLRDERLLAGTSIYAEDTNTSKPNDYAGLYFAGNSSALEGDLIFCATRTDDGKSAPEYENTKLTGRWFYHNDYTLEIQLNLPGSREGVIIKSEELDSQGNWKLKFQNISNGEISSMTATMRSGENDFFIRGGSVGDAPFINGTTNQCEKPTS